MNKELTLDKTLEVIFHKTWFANKKASEYRFNALKIMETGEGEYNDAAYDVYCRKADIAENKFRVLYQLINALDIEEGYREYCKNQII